MTFWLAVLIGVLLGGPLWVGLSLWASRRLWRSARRLLARARGQEQLAELGQLAGGLAHEIKNPLSTINVNLSLLEEDLRRFDDEAHQRWLRRLRSVQEEAARVKGILDDFLRFAGKIELNLSVADLRRLVGELLDFFAPQAEAARVVLRSSLSDDPVPCRVDADLLKQALLNLVINAVQAMPDGGELILRVCAEGRKGVIEVIDTGRGIPPERRAKIFEAYYSTKPHGTGLGLPMTRRIILEHQGSIQVESEPGKGTRFIIRLPLGAKA